MPRSFEHRFVVTIGDTNMEQNVYWANYCQWFGHARELFMMSLLPPEQGIREFLRERRIALITCDVSMKFVRPAFFGDAIVAALHTERWGRCSLELAIEFRDDRTGQVIATGRQKVAFANADTRRFMPIPEEIRRPAEQYTLPAPATTRGVRRRQT